MGKGLRYCVDDWEEGKGRCKSGDNRERLHFSQRDSFSSDTAREAWITEWGARGGCVTTLFVLGRLAALPGRLFGQLGRSGGRQWAV